VPFRIYQKFCRKLGPKYVIIIFATSFAFYTFYSISLPQILGKLKYALKYLSTLLSRYQRQLKLLLKELIQCQFHISLLVINLNYLQLRKPSRLMRLTGLPSLNVRFRGNFTSRIQINISNQTKLSQNRLIMRFDLIKRKLSRSVEINA